SLMAMPSAPASNGLQRPRGERARVLENDKNENGFCWASTPPAIITSLFPARSSLTAASRAAREEAQAASTTILIPPRLNRLETRPAITFCSVPEKLSSVIAGVTSRRAAITVLQVAPSNDVWWIKCSAIH